MSKKRGNSHGKFTGRGHSRPAPKVSPAMLKLVNDGIRQQIAGDQQGAEAIYRQILAQDPNNPPALLYLGTIEINRNNYKEAETLIERAHANGLQNESYYINAGLCNLRLGKLEKAVELLQIGVKMAPRALEAHLNLGTALTRLHRHEEAAASFKLAEELQPGEKRTAYQLACSLQEARRYEEAIIAFRKILEDEPENARVNSALGLALLRSYRPEEGLPYAQKAVELEPSNVVSHYNLAHILRILGRLDEAQKHFQAALDKDPDCVEALIGIGRILTDIGRFQDSISYFDHAIELAPKYYNAYASRGMSCLRNAPAEALVWFDKALECKPDADDTLMYKGYVLGLMGRSTEAESCMRKAIELNPKFAEHHQNLANILLTQGRVPECLECNREAFTINPRNHLVFSNILLYSHYLTQGSRDDLWHLHQNYNNMYSKQMQVGAPPPFPNARNPEKRLRIGIVSADFRHHSCLYFLTPLFQGYDRKKIELIGYSSVKSPDGYTERLRKLCNGWRDIKKVSDKQAAALIYRDGVDILIDLGGHTSDNRLPVFFFKPAPIQIAWLGYPDTSGLSAMDYRISDSFADPEGTEKYSSENLIRLPGGFHCYSCGNTMPEVGSLPADTNGYVTFGSFNNYAKVSEETVWLWSEVLKNSPGSRLLLKSLGLDDEGVREAVWKRFEKLGIERERVEILGRLNNPEEHLKVYNRVDIALDTYPYNGTTTTFEALLMGVPVITLGGQTHASLVGHSILHNCGMGELASLRPDEYVSKAISLAKQLPLLRELHTNLRGRMQKSPLMDEPGFCRKFEEAMRLVWAHFCKQSPEAAPSPFATQPSNNLTLNFDAIRNSEPKIKLDFAANSGTEEPKNELKLDFNSLYAAQRPEESTGTPPTPPQTLSEDLKLDF